MFQDELNSHRHSVVARLQASCCQMYLYDEVDDAQRGFNHEVNAGLRGGHTASCLCIGERERDMHTFRLGIQSPKRLGDHTVDSCRLPVPRSAPMIKRVGQSHGNGHDSRIREPPSQGSFFAFVNGKYCLHGASALAQDVS